MHLIKKSVDIRKINVLFVIISNHFTKIKHIVFQEYEDIDLSYTKYMTFFPELMLH